MSMSTQTGMAGATARERPLFLWRHLVLVLAGYAVLYISVRWYEESYGWTAGLDAFTPEFETYWMNFLYTEITLEIIAGALLWGWLWRTRDPNLESYWRYFLDTETVLARARGAALPDLSGKTRDRRFVVLTPREELRRNLTHLIWLAAYAWTFYWG